MTIGIENILNISAKEWFEITGKKPNEYKVNGVHALCVLYCPPNEFMTKVPSEAEVVVAYRLTPIISKNSRGTITEMYISGTALIPKKK